MSLLHVSSSNERGTEAWYQNSVSDPIKLEVEYGNAEIKIMPASGRTASVRVSTDETSAEAREHIEGWSLKVSGARWTLRAPQTGGTTIQVGRGMTQINTFAGDVFYSSGSQVVIGGRVVSSGGSRRDPHVVVEAWIPESSDVELDGGGGSISATVHLSHLNVDVGSAHTHAVSVNTVDFDAGSASLTVDALHHSAKIDVGSGPAYITAAEGANPRVRMDSGSGNLTTHSISDARLRAGSGRHIAR